MLAEKCIIRFIERESFTGPQDERISTFVSLFRQ